ncbi:MAG: single-stranded DNA-binding protein, partial [Verrucomicrobiota bacterium]
MIDLNVTTLAGRITRDPQVGQTPSGTSVANVTLAVNRRWRDLSGIQREETAFVPVVFFGRPAEWMAECKKGAPIVVSCRLKSD